MRRKLLSSENRGAMHWVKSVCTRPRWPWLKVSLSPRCSAPLLPFGETVLRSPRQRRQSRSKNDLLWNIRTGNLSPWVIISLPWVSSKGLGFLNCDTRGRYELLLRSPCADARRPRVPAQVRSILSLDKQYHLLALWASTDVAVFGLRACHYYYF